MLGYRVFNSKVLFETRNSVISMSSLNSSLIGTSYVSTGNCAQFYQYSPNINLAPCYTSSGQVQNYFAVCEYIGGDSTTSQQCIFPFRYNKRRSWFKWFNQILGNDGLGFINIFSVGFIFLYLKRTYKNDTIWKMFINEWILIVLHSIFILFFLSYKGKLYDRCLTIANGGVPWCPTATNQTTFEVLPGQQAPCISSVKVNDCPLGFRLAGSEPTCYRVWIYSFINLNFSHHLKLRIFIFSMQLLVLQRR